MPPYIEAKHQTWASLSESFDGGSLGGGGPSTQKLMLLLRHALPSLRVFLIGGVGGALFLGVGIVRLCRGGTTLGEGRPHPFPPPCPACSSGKGMSCLRGDAAPSETNVGGQSWRPGATAAVVVVRAAGEEGEAATTATPLPRTCVNDVAGRRGSLCDCVVVCMRGVTPRA